MTIVFFWFR